MRLRFLFISALAFTGSLALPQGATAPGVSLPGVNLAPAQTACIEVCSAPVANADPASLNACVSTGTIPPACLCGDARLAPQLQSCLATRCPSLKGRCAAILGGTAFIAPASSAPSVGIPGAGVDQQSNGAPGTPGQVGVPGPSTGATAEGQQGANIVGGDFPSASFPDVQLSVAAQTDCIRHCSQQVADTDQGILMTCASQTGNAARCLCSNRNLRSDMQLCFQSTCPPLAGRCAAIFGTQAFGDSRSGASSPGQAAIPSSSPSPVPPGGDAADSSPQDQQDDDDDGRSASFPDLPLSPAAQTACILRCSQQVSDADQRLLTACTRANGNAAECLCTDRELRADMELCFQDTCPDLIGRCAAILGSGIFVAGVQGIPSSASPGSSSPGTSSPGTSSPGRPAPGNAGPGTSPPGTPAQGLQEDATGGTASGGSTDSQLGTPAESANEGGIPNDSVSPIATTSMGRTPLAVSGGPSSTISISTASVATDVSSPSSDADNAPSGGLDAENGARSNTAAVVSMLAGPATLVIAGLLV